MAEALPSASARKRLLLVDDQVMFREGIRALLEKAGDLVVVAEAGNGHDGVALTLEQKPDIVLMDVSLPMLNGIEATRLIKQERPSQPVMALSLHADRRMVGQMLKAGASGYVLKDSPLDELRRAIGVVASGGTYLSAAIADVVVSCFVRGGEEEKAHGEGLTPREREVLQLLAEGFVNRQIADRLQISVKTIDTHRYQIMRKLKFRGLADLTRYALREGISSLDAEASREGTRART